MVTKSRRAMLVVMASAAVTMTTLATRAADEPAMPNAPAMPDAPKVALPAAITAGQMNATFTVSAIDAANRTLTLKTPDNSQVMCTAGESVRNLAQIKVGDRVNATLVDEMAVAVGKPGMPPAPGGMVSLAPKGAQPGMMMAKTQDITAKICGIDAQKRMITIEAAGGQCKTIGVSSSVNLAELKKGDDITAQWTSAQAISLQPASVMEALPAGATMTPEGARPGMPAPIAVGEVKADFTVQSVDPEKRMLMLKAADGSICSCMAGKEVQNLDQIKVGQDVRAIMVDEMAVSVRKVGTPAAAGDTEMVAMTPKGAKPAMLMVKADELTTKVLGIDAGKRLLTVEGPEGADKIIKAGPGVNLAELTRGEEVILRWTPAMAVDVQAPQGDISARPAGELMKPMDTIKDVKDTMKDTMKP
jgi:hypothetical protein